MEATFKSTELRRHPPRKCFFTQNFDLELNKIFFVRSNSKSGNDSIKKIYPFNFTSALISCSNSPANQNAKYECFISFSSNFSL